MTVKEKNINFLERLKKTDHQTIINLDNLDISNYNYIIIGRDDFLSGWGEARNKSVYNYMLVKGDKVDAMRAIDRMRVNSFSNVDYYSLEHETIPNKRGIKTLRLLEDSPLFNGERD